MKTINNLFFVLVLLLNTTSKAYDHYAEAEANADDLRAGHKNKAYSDISREGIINRDLRKVNLKCSNLKASSFLGSNLENSCLHKVRAAYASFASASLKNADLSYGFFYRVYFFDANLEGTIVTGADFSNALGLTNEQKKYLRDNGAINVPKDLTEEEFIQERLKVENSFRVKFQKFVERFLKVTGIEFAIISYCKVLEILFNGALHVSHFVLIDLWKKIGNGTIKTAKQLKEFLSKKESLDLEKSKA